MAWRGRKPASTQKRHCLALAAGMAIFLRAKRTHADRFDQCNSPAKRLYGETLSRPLFFAR